MCAANRPFCRTECRHTPSPIILTPLDTQPVTVVISPSGYMCSVQFLWRNAGNIGRWTRPRPSEQLHIHYCTGSAASGKSILLVQDASIMTTIEFSCPFPIIKTRKPLHRGNAAQQRADISHENPLKEIRVACCSDTPPICMQRRCNMPLW
jgi:hypothetical protein